MCAYLVLELDSEEASKKKQKLNKQTVLDRKGRTKRHNEVRRVVSLNLASTTLGYYMHV